MMQEKILGEIDRKLDIIVRLLAARSAEGSSGTDSIIKLGALGLDRKLIAEIVGTTPGVVSTRLSEAKKKGKRCGKTA